MANSYFNENTLEDLIDEIEYVYTSDKRPWIIGYSGGKDSTVVVHLVYMMLKRYKDREKCSSSDMKKVYVVSSDTMVENPLIKIYLEKMIGSLERAAQRDDLPIQSQIVRPRPTDTFWTNVIGKGFPTPRLNGSFRWCTDRLKIDPSGRFIQKIIEEQDTEVVILLGVRKDESIARKKRIEGREIIGRLLNRHETIKRAYVYPVISELTTGDIWDILLSNNAVNAWEGNNAELISLYGDADSAECPFAGNVRKGEQTETCGKSRFGCWVCTVVKEDRSLNGFIKAGHHELKPLADFRTWLIEIRDVPDNREKKRRDGTVYTTKSGKVGLGPFKWEMRKEILRRVLQLQIEMNYQLITLDELKAIDQIWDEELDLRRNSLVDLYFECTGEKLPWHDLKKPMFDDQVIEKIEEKAKKAEIPLDLLKGLIFTANKTMYYSNTQKTKKALEKVLSQQWLHQDLVRELEDED